MSAFLPLEFTQKAMFQSPDINLKKILQHEITPASSSPPRILAEDPPHDITTLEHNDTPTDSSLC